MSEMKLAEMSPSQAASKAFEVMAYGEYVKAQNPEHSWRTPFEGSFEDYVNHYYTEDFRSEYGDEEPFNWDSDSVWQEHHYETGEGSYNGWTAKTVASHGGEGQGEEYWLVIYVSDGETEKYLRRDGWYASYDGGYLDGETYEVKPVERLVTFYE